MCISMCIGIAIGSLCFSLTAAGPTFSWAGDPSSLRDLVDAVRRGHSVDWAEVHRKAGDDDIE